MVQMNLPVSKIEFNSIAIDQLRKTRHGHHLLSLYLKPYLGTTLFGQLGYKE